MTLPEKILWQFLRGSSFAGLRFRRQHPVGGFIADFCCPRKKLVIELDGEYHMRFQKEDANRDNALQKQGFRVLHFTNDHVFDRIEWILQTIADELAIDWGKNYHDCVARVKYPQKLYSLLRGIRQHREKPE
jgi:very-short-patch-repair endonuclease